MQNPLALYDNAMLRWHEDVAQRLQERTGITCFFLAKGCVLLVAGIECVVAIMVLAQDPASSPVFVITAGGMLLAFLAISLLGREYRDRLRERAGTMNPMREGAWWRPIFLLPLITQINAMIHMPSLIDALYAAEYVLMISFVYFFCATPLPPGGKRARKEARVPAPLPSTAPL